MFYSFSFAQTGKLTTYSNPTFGIKINYPDNWEIDTGEFVEIPGDYITSIVGIYPTIEGENEEYLPVYVEIGIDESVQPISLPQYLDDVINSYTGEESSYEDDTILVNDAYRTKFANQDGYQIVLTGEFEGEVYKVLEIGTIYRGKPYFIKYDAEEALYEKYLPIVSRMITSFQFTK